MESSGKVSPRIDVDVGGAPTVYISVPEIYFYQSSPNSSTINNKNDTYVQFLRVSH